MSEQPAETPTKAARVLLGWFAGGLAFQCIEKYANAPTIWPSIGYGLAAVVVAVGDYKLPWLLSKSPKLTASINRWAADARLWIAIGLCTLLIGIFSPFVEQQRWPFSTWFQTTNGASNVSKTDYDALNEKLEKLNGLVESLQSALGSTRETLEATRIDRDQLKQQLVVAQSKLQDTTSQLEAARQAAHQPPPPPPPEDQIPIRWNADFQMLWGGANGPDAQMMGFRFIGETTALARIKDAYVLSELTGHKEQLQVFTPYNGEHISIDQLEPIPQGANVWLVVKWKPPLPFKDFLNQWTKFQFVVVYDDKQYQRSFDQDFMNRKMTAEMAGAFGPRPTKKSDVK